MDEFLQHLLGTSTAAAFVGYLIKFLITHYFKQKTKLEETKDELDKTRVSRQTEINERTKEIIDELRDRQHEFTNTISIVNNNVAQLTKELIDVKKAFSDLQVSVEKSNAKYDVVTSKFAEYVPAVNGKLTIIEEKVKDLYGKIIQK